MTKRNYKKREKAKNFKVKEKAKIIANHSNHEFEIGEIVTIRRKSHGSDDYYATNKETGWWVVDSELEKVSIKNIKITLIGSGTKQEVVEALKDMTKEINSLTDTEIGKGGDLENDILTCQFDENTL